MLKNIIKKNRISFYLSLIFFYSICLNSCWFIAPRHETLTLPNGKQIKMLGLVKLYSSKQQDWALVFKYQTDIDFDNDLELKKEAELIWEFFRHKVEQEGYKYGVVSAHTPAKGFIITIDRAKNFAFYKNEHGQWQPLVEENMGDSQKGSNAIETKKGTKK